MSGKLAKLMRRDEDPGRSAAILAGKAVSVCSPDMMELVGLHRGIGVSLKSDRLGIVQG